MTVQRPQRLRQAAATTPFPLRLPVPLAATLVERQATHRDVSTNAYIVGAIADALRRARVSGVGIKSAPAPSGLPHPSAGGSVVYLRIPDPLYRELQDRSLRKLDASITAFIVVALTERLRTEAEDLSLVETSA